MTDANAPAYCCPSCKGRLDYSGDAYWCDACHRGFPVVFGIPDFRIKPDPYITIDDDRAKGLRIARECSDRTLRGLLTFYWTITESVESSRAARFVESVLRGRQRGESIVKWLSEKFGAPGTTCLEVGCGAGAMLPVLHKYAQGVTGVDRAFRWLVVAKIAAEQSGQAVRLACANAEHLPFADNAFDSVIADAVIEHQQERGDQLALATECLRAIRPKGVLFLSTPNRFAPMPDPHFAVPLLGMLPRSLAPHAVRRWRGKTYEFIRLLGRAELLAILREAGAARVKLAPAHFSAELFASPTTARIYAALAKNKLFLGTCPVIWAVAVKRQA